MGDADSMNSSMDTPSKSFSQRITSDYRDIHTKSFDPEFITDISTKMQVPEKLGVSENTDSTRRNHVMNNVHDMTVPERILISEGGKHVGAREKLRQFDFESSPETNSMQYVGLITPPRTLTLEEAFPILEPQEEDSINENRQIVKSNGDISRADPYTPGASLNESILMNEADEVTKLQIQIRKLSRRVDMVELDNQTLFKRFHYIIGGYVIFKLFWWMWWRTKN